MVYIKLATTILALVLALAGCNTTEALTPPSDVGDGTAVADNSTGGLSPSGNDAAGGQDAFPPAPANQQAYAAPPQNSLDAQARSLAAGNAPMQPPPPVYGNGQQATLQSPQQQQMPAAPSAQQQQGQRQPAQQQAALAPGGGPTIRFLPIIGAPVQAVTPLSRQLGAEARANGLTIKGASDPASEHILKGYFSAFSDGGKVNVVYVWDILDASGGRLHRIQGQESFASSAADPWAAVPPALMQQIATRTIAEYLSWRRATSG